MNKTIGLLIATFLFTLFTFAQKDRKVALTINDKPIYKNELQADFTKNRLVDDNGKKESIDTFLNSYIAHKLVLEEAKEQRIDTTVSFKRVLSSYEIQLSKHMLKDTIVEKKMVEDILKHFDEELEVNHAFIPIDSLMKFAQDTVVPYQKALAVRKVAMEQGFDKIDVEDKVNSFGIILDVEKETGYLGWIRPLMFSFPLENVLYSLKINEVTMPIRTKSGYHILQVVGKRPMSGNPIVEQVMFNFPIIPATRHIEDSVYQVAIATYDEISIQNNFQLICDEFAAVFNTEDTGCLLGEIRADAQIPSALIQAAFNLENAGDVSKPILTSYGYHILRLVKKTALPTKQQRIKFIESLLTNEKIYPELVARKRIYMIEKDKAQINQTAYKQLKLLTNRYSPVDNEFEDAVTNKENVLLSIGDDDQYTVQDFLDYVEATAWMYAEPSKEDNPLLMMRYEAMLNYTLTTDILNDLLNSFIYIVLSKYEERSLKNKNPQYLESMANLSDGLLHTELMEKEVWKKSKMDVVGLERIYNANKDKYSLKGKCFKGIIVQSKNEATLLQIENLYKSDKITASAIKEKFNKEAIVVMLESGLWQEGENAYVDTKIYKTKNKSAALNFPFYTVIGEFITSPQDYTDVRSQVELDYQKELSEKLKATLENKFVVVINNAVIKEIK